MIIRLCQNGKQITHQMAVKIHQQLSLHPEVCDECSIKPCVFAEYMYGKLMKVKKENKISDPN